MAHNLGSVIHGYERQKEEEQARLVASENGLPYINLVNYAFTAEVLAIIPKELSLKFQAVAFAKNGFTVKVATPLPHQPGLAEAMNEIGQQQKLTFVPHLCSTSSINYSLEQYQKLVKKMTETAAKAHRSTIEEFQAQMTQISDLAGAVKGVNTTEIFEIIMSGALAFEATDVHLEPQATDVQVRFRIDGELQTVVKISLSSYHLLLSRVKNLAKLKLNKLKSPQDGRFTLKIGEEDLDIRVSVLPASYGETVVMRLLTGKGLLNLDTLGLDEATNAAIKKASSQETGMILVTGPTGSGKTTTLYAILQSLNDPSKKIVTIEDPVEYKIPGVEQIQVDPDGGFDFADALRGILRQDPDVILVGEIRDKNTAEIALNAALTGHLVLATLHANSAAATFSRLTELGTNTNLLTDSIRLILGQKLVKKVCDNCQGKGCDVCHGTGFKGQKVEAKFIEPDERYADLIKRQASVREFEQLSN